MSKIRYHVVTVQEGGADFDDYDTLSSLISAYNVKDEDIKALVMGKIGDQFSVDGCSSVYFLNPSNGK